MSAACCKRLGQISKLEAAAVSGRLRFFPFTGVCMVEPVRRDGDNIVRRVPLPPPPPNKTLHSGDLDDLDDAITSVSDRAIPGGIPGEDGADAPVIPGRDGLPGRDGFGIPGQDGEHADVVVIPGRDGRPGADAQSIPGSDGDCGENAPIIPARDGKDGRDAQLLPGLDGIDGDNADSMPGRDGLPGRDGRFAMDGADGEDAPMPSFVGLSRGEMMAVSMMSW